MLKHIWPTQAPIAFVRIHTQAPTSFERSKRTPCLLVFSFECPPDKIVGFFFFFVEVKKLVYAESREVSKFRYLKTDFLMQDGSIQPVGFNQLVKLLKN